MVYNCILFRIHPRFWCFPDVSDPFENVTLERDSETDPKGRKYTKNMDKFEKYHNYSQIRESLNQFLKVYNLLKNKT